MAKTIDPAFQAAPNLGASSYDPIEFTRRHKLEKFQIQKKQQEEQVKNTAEGLSNLMMDVKGWEDQDGFKEIMADQDRILKGFLSLSKKGMNLVSPKTTDEIMAFKTINDEHAKVKQKVNTWQQQKSIYDLYTKAIELDSLLPPDEQKIDKEATMANIQKVLKSKGIIERGNGLQNLVVRKPDIGDVDAFINKNKDRIPKLDTIAKPYTDESGQTVNRLEQISTPEKEKEIIAALRNLYKYAEPNIKYAIQRQGELNKGNEPVGFTDEDRFVARAYPAYAQKFIDKVAGGGSGFNINLFGNQKVKVQPAIKNENNVHLGDRDYNEHYDFNITKPFIGLNMSSLGASVYQGDTWEPASKEGGLVNAQLNFYDPKTDSFIFTSTANAMDAGVFKSQTFSVPRANLGKEVDELPITKDDGKPGKLKDIYKKESTTVKKLPLPNNFWSKPAAPYIPKSKK